MPKLPPYALPVTGLAGLPVPQPMRYTTPSALTVHTECPSQWAYHALYRVKKPQNDSAKLGDVIHAEVEAYLRDGTALGPLAAAGMHLLPPAGSARGNPPQVIVEAKLGIQMPGQAVPIIGRLDQLLPASATVIDLKSSKNLSKYRKTVEDLAIDPQANVYSLIAGLLLYAPGTYDRGTFDIFPHPDNVARYAVMLPHPVPYSKWLDALTKGIRFQHVYVQTEGKPRADSTHVDFTLGRLLERSAQLVDRVNSMYSLAKDLPSKGIDSLPVNRAACNNFGGCFYKAICEARGAFAAAPFATMGTIVTEKGKANSMALGALKNKATMVQQPQVQQPQVQTTPANLLDTLDPAQYRVNPPDGLPKGAALPPAPVEASEMDNIAKIVVPYTLSQRFANQALGKIQAAEMRALHAELYAGIAVNAQHFATYRQQTDITTGESKRIPLRDDIALIIAIRTSATVPTPHMQTVAEAERQTVQETLPVTATTIPTKATDGCCLDMLLIDCAPLKGCTATLAADIMPEFCDAAAKALGAVSYHVADADYCKGSKVAVAEFAKVMHEMPGMGITAVCVDTGASYGKLLVELLTPVSRVVIRG